jgi:hypothetical protein
MRSTSNVTSGSIVPNCDRATGPVVAMRAKPVADSNTPSRVVRLTTARVAETVNPGCCISTLPVAITISG